MCIEIKTTGMKGDFMGGKEGSRGYLYQAFAAILEALNEDNWSNIIVELSTDNDKVDIAIEVNEQVVRTIQVKSSINLFKKSDINKWILELIDDYPSEEYTLHLIGNCDSKANKFIKAISKKDSSDWNDEMKDALNEVDKKILTKNISVKLTPFNIQTLEAIVRDSLNRYIFSKGEIIDYRGLDLIAQSATMTFMLLSTEGKAISRECFDNKIYSWLKCTLGGYLKSAIKYPSHKLLIYEKNTRTLSNQVSEIAIENYYNVNDFNNSQVNNVQYLVEKIKNINIPKLYNKENEMQDVPNHCIDGNILNSVSLLKKIGLKCETEYWDADDEKKKDLIRQVFELTAHQLDINDLYVGDLKVIKKQDFMVNYSEEIIGTEEQKEKYELIKNLDDIIFEQELFNILLDEFKDYSILPIVIRNDGEVADLNLKVKVFIPKYIKIITEINLDENELINFVPELFAMEGGIIEKIFQRNSDSLVALEDRLPYIGDPLCLYTSGLGSSYKVSHVYNKLTHYIGQEIYDDDPDYHILQYEISELLPGEAKYLGNPVVLSGLLEDVKIKYEIKSNKLNEIIQGNITLLKA